MQRPTLPAPSDDIQAGLFPAPEKLVTPRRSTWTWPDRPSLKQKRSGGAIAASWVEGRESTGAHVTALEKSKAGRAGRNLAAELVNKYGHLTGVPTQQWVRALDTAYLLGTRNYFTFVAGYFGVGGKPDLPVTCGYVLGSAGTVVLL